MKYATHLKVSPKGKKVPSLADLSEYYKIKNPSAHRAYADAITTARVFEKLKLENNR